MGSHERLLYDQMDTKIILFVSAALLCAVAALPSQNTITPEASPDTILPEEFDEEFDGSRTAKGKKKCWKYDVADCPEKDEYDRACAKKVDNGGEKCQFKRCSDYSTDECVADADNVARRSGCALFTRSGEEQCDNKDCRSYGTDLTNRKRLLAEGEESTCTDDAVGAGGDQGCEVIDLGERVKLCTKKRN